MSGNSIVNIQRISVISENHGEIIIYIYESYYCNKIEKYIMASAFKFLLIIMLISISCRGPNEPAPIRTDWLGPIYIPGIVRSDEMGNKISEIGYPENGGVGAYPNPSNGGINVPFAVPNYGNIVLCDQRQLNLPLIDN